MALHPPMCPECSGESRPIGLRTKPIVFECYDCSELFTRRSRGVPVATLRTMRRQIVQRWDQLADDVHHLLQEIRTAPAGTFTDAERDDVEHELNQTVWDVMVNHRPRLPGGARRRASLETQQELKRLRIIRDFIDSGEYAKLVAEEAAAEGG